MEEKDTIRVFIAEDHPGMRNGLALCINSQDDMIVCGESDRVDDALHQVKKTHPDVVLVDLTLKKEDGFSLIQKLNSTELGDPAGKCLILVITANSDINSIHKAFSANVHGFYNKEDRLENLPIAIRKIVQGGMYYSDFLEPHIHRLLAGYTPHQAAIKDLSKREKEIFLLLGESKQPKDIESLLCIGSKTVYTHLENIKHKLSISSLQELSKFAKDWKQFNT